MTLFLKANPPSHLKYVLFLCYYVITQCQRFYRHIIFHVCKTADISKSYSLANNDAMPQYVMWLCVIWSCCLI